MKKQLFLSVFILLFAVHVFSQSIKDDYIDEFTGKHIIRTSWIEMTFNMTTTGYFRISKINSTYYLNFRIMGDIPFATTINEGPVFLFKLSDNSIIKLYNTELKVVSTGGGAVGLIGSKANGVTLNLYIEPCQIDSIMSIPIIKFRLQTEDGHFDRDFSENRYSRLKKLFELVYRNNP